MFTGIVQGRASVEQITEKQNFKSFLIKFPAESLTVIERGASVAINGCCLTVTDYSIDNLTACFDVMQESLKLTNLGILSVGDEVNFERAAKIGDEIGGHMMSGHISGTVKLLEKIQTNTNCELVFSLPSKFQKYVLPKGFVGLNGCSLTIGEEVGDCFSIYLIPETLAVTTFAKADIGDPINLEIDPQTQAIVDTVERYLDKR